MWDLGHGAWGAVGFTWIYSFGFIGFFRDVGSKGLLGFLAYVLSRIFESIAFTNCLRFAGLLGFYKEVYGQFPKFILLAGFLF